MRRDRLAGFASPRPGARLRSGRQRCGSGRRRAEPGAGRVGGAAGAHVAASGRGAHSSRRPARASPGDDRPARSPGGTAQGRQRPRHPRHPAAPRAPEPQRALDRAGYPPAGDQRGVGGVVIAPRGRGRTARGDRTAVGAHPGGGRRLSRRGPQSARRGSDRTRRGHRRRGPQPRARAGRPDAARRPRDHQRGRTDADRARPRGEPGSAVHPDPSARVRRHDGARPRLAGDPAPRRVGAPRPLHRPLRHHPRGAGLPPRSARAPAPRLALLAAARVAADDGRGATPVTRCAIPWRSPRWWGYSPCAPSTRWRPAP